MRQTRWNGRGGRSSTTTISVAPIYALLFPSNVSGADTSAPYAVIEFADPQTSGFPFLGPSNAGWTVIRRIKPLQQTGYYAQFWYSNAGGSFVPTEQYVGCHPYPQSATNQGTTHWWEIAGDGGGDFFDHDSGGTHITVTQSQWYLQAFTLEYNAGNPRYTFWTNLPDTTAGTTVIRRTCSVANGGTTPSTPKFTIGDSPWYAGYQHERASCHHGQIKIITTAMTQADIVSESANMNALVTAAAQSNIWWGKKGFASVNDLTCDYGTGRSFTRNDTSNLLSLGEAL